MEFLLVMGVSGCGKSTVAKQLADRLGGAFIEADDLHPRSNLDKMSAGIPLDDADRMPWLEAVAKAARYQSRPGRPVVLACSALKERYRAKLREILPDLTVIYLRGDFDRIRQRMEARAGHFMPSSLLTSQFADLEEPREGLVLDIGLSPGEMVRVILGELDRSSRTDL